ncbi:sulfatase [Flavobacterium sp. 316]|uniref:Sulfatase-like hydrolase/transferase n=1 Tax=Flavobacterium sediminilitoris TaxID=2024526 RepID=A0ABY4HJC8_9FLAO|nr:MULTISPECIES: alkaline phosphatase family protein [Flavobacterium]KIX22628.1 sulfatase [Flavobacterium sp. 316]UOX32937.1 sulfatase-like hydrolase/transferase [Flavobacterium sediminilitoris]
MKLFFRLEEYKVLAYRILLAYLFYFFARILFYLYNSEMVEVSSIIEFLKISYHGLAFDTTSILYINGLFILLSILPFFINTHKKYQKGLFWLYFISNLSLYSLNFIDFIYYKYNFSRLTLAAWDIIKHEESKGGMLFRFVITYWHVFILYILTCALWVFLYNRVKIKNDTQIKSKVGYVLKSILGVLIVATLCVGGIRGDFKKSTRPINLVDANRHVAKIQQADLVLNSTFTFLRTLGVKTFKKQDFNISNEVIEESFKPIKFYSSNNPSKPNIVLIITESLGREYCGAFNKHLNIKDYVSYTPFLDSLANHSMIYTNAYANGYKSIHGMSSVLSGIPSFKDAFTSSPYAKQKIESMVSCLKEKGYDTSFFHGAPNGSMGFLGYGNILGFDHYYGMTEYGNDTDFDGSWGIWDEPFMQFMNTTISKKKQPFFSTIFTVSSHEPYVVPEKYKDKFPKGNIPMHQCVGYTDFAFKQFFNAAKKEPWFNNTIFVITADHCNQVNYFEDYYHNIMNRLAVPILIYKPNSDLVGNSDEIAQHIDIYPTVMDMIGYDKPFRSWGRSLLTKEKDIKPYLINYNSNNYYFMKDGYICVFDGKNAIGFYDEKDKKLIQNLISNRNQKMNKLEQECKAFIQDYFNKIIDKKLSTK